MMTSFHAKRHRLQAALCVAAASLILSHAQAVDGFKRDAASGCAIFRPNLNAGETVTFNGRCVNGFGEGPGVATWRAPDGGSVTFEGTFVQGKLNGNGQMTASGGDRYQGGYKDGKREGNGVYTSANGDRFDGQYKDNQRNGHGILTLADGSRKEGEWQYGNPMSGQTTQAPGEGAVEPHAIPPQASASSSSASGSMSGQGHPVQRPSQAPSATAQQPSAMQRIPNRPWGGQERDSGPTPSEQGVETKTASGAVIRVDRCIEVHPYGSSVRTDGSSVAVAKIPNNIDLKNWTKSGTYTAEQANGGVFMVLKEATELVQKYCPVKAGTPLAHVDMMLYVDKLPPMGTRWSDMPMRSNDLDKNSPVVAQLLNGRWYVINRAANAAVQAEQQRQAEQKRQAQVAAQTAEQKKEKDKGKAQEAKLAQFISKHNLQVKDTKGLGANPFAFEGERLFVVGLFQQMQSASTALFFVEDGNVVMVNDIPKGAFREKGKVVLAVKVLGSVRFDGVVGGLMPVNGMIPNLKYLGALICHDERCMNSDEKS